MTSAMRSIVPVLSLLCACSSGGAQPAADAGAGASAGAGAGGGAGGSGGEPNLCAQIPTGKVELPKDDTVHSDPMEWWYWTGHLQTDASRWFGFELVFFRALELGIPGEMAHVAVTDIEDGTFHHSATTLPGSWTTVADGFTFSMNNQTAVGGDGHDSLHGEVDGYVFDLSLDAIKAPVLQHDGGYTDYPFGGYTYYYSRERMAAQGTLVAGGTSLPVHGTGWFDHQWGDIQSALQAGWDWFAFQLDDQREIMLFVVRENGQQVLVGGSLSDANCQQTSIPATAVEVTPLGSWQSPHTSCTYPSGWTVKVNDETFTVTPTLPDQEVSTALPIYWEGACTVSGSATGRAYVELTGYCP